MQQQHEGLHGISGNPQIPQRKEIPGGICYALLLHSYQSCPVLSGDADQMKTLNQSFPHGVLLSRYAVNKCDEAAIRLELPCLSLWLEEDSLLPLSLGTCSRVLAKLQTHWLTSKKLKKAETIYTSRGSDPIFTIGAVPSTVHVNKVGRKLKESNSSYLCSWNISSVSYAKDSTETE